jgi:glycosyltransferase involved in cell wall biosynthesis
MSVIFLMRKQQMGYHSFERVFSDLKNAMPDNVHVRTVHSWFHSNGFFKRLLNLVQLQFLRADVYHITGDIHYLALGLIGRKVVLTVHDLAPLLRKKGLGRAVFKLLWYTWPMKIAKVTTAISEATKRELVEHTGADPDKIVVIPVCISPDFKPCPKSWPQPPERPVVLMVGTKPNKNLERMFLALQGIDVEVRIMGRLDRVQRESFERTGVLFRELGLLSDEEVVQAYRDCDLLAFASTYEGFGMPIVEAQAVGRPVLTSNHPPMSDIAGEGALLVDPEDIVSMQTAFFQIINAGDLRETLVKKGFASIQKYFSVAIAAIYLSAYQRSLAKNPMETTA